MSGKFSTALMFVFLVAIAVAANRAEEVTRGPAGEMSDKEATLGEFRAGTSLSHTQKVRGPIAVQLRSERDGDLMVVHATVSTRKAINGGGDFSWSLPDGVELVSGSLTGHLAALTPDQPTQVELTVRRLVESNVQIHLLVAAAQDGVRFADSAQLNTNPHAAVLQRAPASELKVFH